TLKDTGGAQVASLLVGKSRFGRGGPASDGTYVRKSGEAQAWLVRGRLAPDKEPERLLERRVIAICRDRVRDVTVVQPDGANLAVPRDKPSDNDFTTADPPADRTAKAAYERNSVGGAWEVLDLDDVRPASDLKFAPEGAYAELHTFDGITVRSEF